MDIQVRVWRQTDSSDKGRMVTYDVKDISPDASFLEMLDVLNEKLILDVDQTNIDPAKWDVDKSELETLKKKPLKGYVCLQVHGGKLDFRNIRIREIKEEK